MRRETGQQGEELAAQYLLDKGYRIIARNYRTRSGEIDIICELGRTIIFVEVKTRRNDHYGSPEEAITKKKIEHIRHTALHYLSQQDVKYKNLRFDVIAILMKDATPMINHIEAAF